MRKPGQRSALGTQLLVAWMSSSGTTTAEVSAALKLTSGAVYNWTLRMALPSPKYWRAIEQLTGGAVPLHSWLEPPADDPTQAAPMPEAG